MESKKGFSKVDKLPENAAPLAPENNKKFQELLFSLKKEHDALKKSTENFQSRMLIFAKEARKSAESAQAGIGALMRVLINNGLTNEQEYEQLFNGAIEDIEKAKEQFEDTLARVVDTDKPAREGDTVVISYKAMFEGKAFNNNVPVKIRCQLNGKDLVIPGLEQSVIGKKAGDSYKIKATWPVDTLRKDVAGQDVEFEVEILKVKHPIKA